MLTDAQRERYLRQIAMDGIGEDGQERLLRAKVLVIGAGGLGSPVLYYLAAAGVGTITVVDSDTVSLSNLNRQILHTEADLDIAKVQSAEEKLHRLNTSLVIRPIRGMLTDDNIEAIMKGQDLIIDCVDNDESRYLVNRYAVAMGIPLVEGGIRGFEGYLLPILPGQSPCYQCVYPQKKKKTPEPIPVLGGTAGAIGSMQAIVGVRILLGLPVPYGKLTMFRFSGLESFQMEVASDPDCPICGSKE